MIHKQQEKDSRDDSSACLLRTLKATMGGLARVTVQFAFAIRWHLYELFVFRPSYAWDRAQMSVAFGHEADFHAGFDTTGLVLDARRFVRGALQGFFGRHVDPTFTARHFGNTHAVKIPPGILVNIAHPTDPERLLVHERSPLILRDLSGRYQLRLRSDHWTPARLYCATHGPAALAFSRHHFGADAFLGGMWIGSTEV